MIQISLDNGKYTLNLPTEIGETMTCDRYDEKNWRKLTGDKLVMTLGQKIIELQAEKAHLSKVLGAAGELCARYIDGQSKRREPSAEFFKNQRTGEKEENFVFVSVSQLNKLSQLIFEKGITP